MAANLAAAGLAVRVWNRTREKAEPLAEHGVEVEDSPADAATGAQVVVTMLADGDAVESVMAGDGEALAAMDDGAVWLQMSTVGIAATERLSRLAADRGVAFVDAPVLGTRAPAEQGELLVLAAGPEAVRDRCAPVFDAVGRETRWLGEDPGGGSRFKLVLNGWLLALTEALSETVALARAIDVDPAQFLDAIDGGPLGPAYAQLKGRPMIDLAFGEVAFPLVLASKDARLVREAAEGANAMLPLFEALERQYARAVSLGHGDEDMAAVHHASRPEDG
jgi:3-hydroxyisobutyrate dehydrogenase